MGVEGIGEENYIRRNLLLADDPKTRAIRRASGGLWILLYRRSPEDSEGPFLARTEEKEAFRPLNYRFA